MVVRAVCFDLDDTLVDSTAAELAAARSFAEHFRDRIVAGEDFLARW